MSLLFPVETQSLWVVAENKIFRENPPSSAHGPWGHTLLQHREEHPRGKKREKTSENEG